MIWTITSETTRGISGRYSNLIPVRRKFASFKQLTQACGIYFGGLGCCQGSFTKDNLMLLWHIYQDEMRVAQYP
jgi:hypothetical protein